MTEPFIQPLFEYVLMLEVLDLLASRVDHFSRGIDIHMMFLEYDMVVDILKKEHIKVIPK